MLPRFGLSQWQVAPQQVLEVLPGLDQARLALIQPDNRRLERPL